jgi:hypothetical protein
MGLSPDIVSERMAGLGLPALSLPGARALNTGALDVILFPKEPLPLAFFTSTSLSLSLSRRVVRIPG